ncbi:MAG: hypothetical protein M2R45_03943 [Verrucomicrobia subdivision 3 bacterium]|nr:hypothetical protein [Limisphaerales bacterium]MCS1417690.1 hypothetical protein [Limisphaerales bacterium]
MIYSDSRSRATGAVIAATNFNKDILRTNGNFPKVPCRAKHSSSNESSGILRTFDVSKHRYSITTKTDGRPNTYVWNGEQTSAPARSGKRSRLRLNIQDSNHPSEHRQQTWNVPSRTEHILCHTIQGVGLLGVNKRQLA